MAGLLRGISMRRAHHPALRACPGMLPYLHRLLLPTSPGWVELKAAARKASRLAGACKQPGGIEAVGASHFALTCP